MTLAGKTLFISGGSRGIGLAIAMRAARDGDNVTLIAKTAEPHPRLEGTVYTAAAQIEAAGGHALPVVGDIRDEAQVERAVGQAVERFGGIDVCVNNASAINLSGTEALEIKRYDLMQSISTRGTFVVSRVRRRGLRGDHQAQPGLHRERVLVRGRAGRRRRDRLRPVRLPARRAVGGRPLRRPRLSRPS
jgi:NAD(P)-dependent dehydrogenase (short-subunit alcohol dehydrogenase family)